MPEHKFVYRVSGMALSDAQKTLIAEEIAVAVARVIATQFPQAAHMSYESPHPVCGGSHRVKPSADEQSGERAEDLDDRQTPGEEMETPSRNEPLPFCKL